MISDRLKTETRYLHDLTEEKFNSKKIFESTFSLEDYRKLLLYNYFLISNFEDAVFSLIPTDAAQKIQLEKRRKLKLIETDLQNLGTELPPHEFSVTVNSEAEAWGVFYVMEGSTLGGNMIAKQLSKNEEFKIVNFSYFRCYGEHTGSYWKSFKEVLDQQVAPEKFEECIAGANKAYRFLLDLP